MFWHLTSHGSASLQKFVLVQAQGNQLSTGLRWMLVQVPAASGCGNLDDG